MATPHGTGSRSIYLTEIEGTEDAGEAGALGILSICPAWPQNLGEEGSSTQRKLVVDRDVSSAELHISLVHNNEKWDIAFREFSFGSSDVNQNSFTWPRLLQAYICLKHLFF